MRLKKIAKYTVLIILLFLITGFILMQRDGKKMYGGLTEKVNIKQFNPQKGLIAIKNVSILSEDCNSMISRQTVLINDENIIKIGVDSLINIPNNSIIIDGSGKYLIPGLADMHVHFFQSSNDLLLYIANGITQVRELIGDENHLKWRDEIKKGERIGPNMFVASPRLGSFDRVEGWFMSWSQGYENISNASEAEKKVKEFYKLGYDGLKVYSQLNKESYLAITKFAKELEMPVFGHIPWDVEFSDIWQNGQSSIAHFEELMNAISREFNADRMIGSYKGKEEEFLKFVEKRSESLAKDLIDNNVYVTSTLWLTESFYRQRYELNKILTEVELEYQNPGISEWVSYVPQGLGWLPEVNRYKIDAKMTASEIEDDKIFWQTYGKACGIIANVLSKKGVKIMSGTDANLPAAVPGFSLHSELQSLNDAGMSISQVLNSATNTPANWLKNNSGKIKVGYKADLVLLDKNPLIDIRNTKKINAVLVNGLLYNRVLLDEILSEVKKANNTSRTINIESFN
ncbi:amidohydrolase family protein [Polaribacter porphyrae]|uniref:Amidohydrolase-related domain-containing protein n=1 Tax=Polaribacter porphyrae TaxID=1137780 RepID=A0A2S7WQV6_9FLAO|nr:amidohydrolase family protein [Polaribacter porphyrae]PQJ79826.1 hypothetical protein BTO18_11850 [Polaribacter porphyrae]